MRFSAYSRFRSLRVWQRNFFVWRKLMIPSLIGNMIDPLFYLFALGLGIGALIGEIEGESYLFFIAPGIVAINVLNVCSFEGMYSAFTRMHMQRTWDAIRNAPVTVDDIVIGEWIWAATKGMLSSTCILAVLLVFGVISPLSALISVPLLLLFGLMCSAVALAYNAVSPGYEFFMYFFTLYMTPLLMLSGAFFPIETLPDWLETVMYLLPMAALVDSLRDVFAGEWPERIWLAVPLVSAYLLCALFAAVRLTRRRLA